MTKNWNVYARVAVMTQVQASTKEEAMELAGNPDVGANWDLVDDDMVPDPDDIEDAELWSLGAEPTEEEERAVNEMIERLGLEQAVPAKEEP